MSGDRQVTDPGNLILPFHKLAGQHRLKLVWIEFFNLFETLSFHSKDLKLWTFYI
jgi:hypothetical protein